MTETAQVILSGYSRSKIAKSARSIRRHSRLANLKIVKDASEIKPKSKLWICENNKPDQEILFLSGTMDDLRTVLDVKTEDGIYSVTQKFVSTFGRRL